MAKKKVDIKSMRKGMGNRNSKSVEEIEDAVSKIHEEEISKPKPKVQRPKIESKTRINLNIPKSQHLKFKIWCLENETTITDEILKFIQSKI